MGHEYLGDVAVIGALPVNAVVVGDLEETAHRLCPRSRGPRLTSSSRMRSAHPSLGSLEAICGPVRPPHLGVDDAGQHLDECLRARRGAGKVDRLHVLPQHNRAWWLFVLRIADTERDVEGSVAGKLQNGGMLVCVAAAPAVSLPCSY